MRVHTLGQRSLKCFGFVSYVLAKSCCPAHVSSLFSNKFRATPDTQTANPKVVGSLFRSTDSIHIDYPRGFRSEPPVNNWTCCELPSLSVCLFLFFNETGINRQHRATSSSIGQNPSAALLASAFLLMPQKITITNKWQQLTVSYIPHQGRPAF